MAQCVAAVDCGTSVVKAMIVDVAGVPRSLTKRRVPCRRGGGGSVTFPADDLERAVYDALSESIQRSGVSSSEIGSVAISNQRATVIPVDDCGAALGDALSWQDGRGAAQVEALSRRIDPSAYYQIAGVPYHPAFSVAKMMWLQSASADLRGGSGRFALVQDYMLKKMGCKDFFCDYSNASLTGLLDVVDLDWSERILEASGIEREKLPALVPSGRPVGELCGEAAHACGLSKGTLLISGGGDHQCAALGAGAVDEGIAEITLGTTVACMCPVEAPMRDGKRRLNCCVHVIPGQWTVEGLQLTGMDALHWVASLLGEQGISDRLLERVAAVSSGSEGVLFFPYFSGATAPHWQATAKSVFSGLNVSHDGAVLARCVLEGISMETREILDVFQELDLEIHELRLSGGGARLDAWCDLQADLYGKPVAIPENTEASLAGAATIAAYGMGVYDTMEEAARTMVKISSKHMPHAVTVKQYDALYERFCRQGKAFREAQAAESLPAGQRGGAS